MAGRTECGSRLRLVGITRLGDGSDAVIRVVGFAYWLEPVGGGIDVDCDMGHGAGWRGSVPVAFARCHGE